MTHIQEKHIGMNHHWTQPLATVTTIDIKGPRRTFEQIFLRGKEWFAMSTLIMGKFI
jgi:hypothetical protein